jgi:hypothetical protein
MQNKFEGVQPKNYPEMSLGEVRGKISEYFQKRLTPEIYTRVIMDQIKSIINYPDSSPIGVAATKNGHIELTIDGPNKEQIKMSFSYNKDKHGWFSEESLTP